MIFIWLRIRGGVKGWGASSSSQPKSFKDAINQRPTPSNPKDISRLAFVVEQAVESLSLQVDKVIYGLLATYYAQKAIIFHFNGFWPSTSTLQEWVGQNGSQNTMMHFCSKGFFVVFFKNLED